MSGVDSQNPLMAMLVKYMETQLKQGDSSLFDALQKCVATTPLGEKTLTATTPSTATPTSSCYSSSSQSQCDDDDVECFLSRNDSATKWGCFDQDKSAVRYDVMKVVDWQGCAPYVSPLFEYKFKVNPDANGRRVRKKKPELNEEELKRLVRPTLRRLVAQSKDKDPRLYERYYNATLFLVRKRRSNHIQNWRKKGVWCHKELIYGGQELYDAKFGNKWKKTKVKGEPQVKVEPQVKKPKISDMFQEPCEEPENIRNNLQEEETPTP